MTVKIGKTTLGWAVENNAKQLVKLILPYADVEESLKEKDLIQRYVKDELARLQVVKESLEDLFHDELLEEVCDFLVSEVKMKAWLPSRKRKREED